MCTLFQLVDQDNFVIGKNYDVPTGTGLLFTNHRHLQKTALILPPDTPVQWISQFGSITFSQVGKEFPVGGMNEMGLVVEQSTLWGTVYPDPDDRPAIRELQWIQFMLDTCDSVQAVLQAAQTIRIAQADAPLH